MLCKVLENEKYRGVRFEKNTIRDVPTAWVEQLEAMGVVERLGAKMHTTLLGQRVSVGVHAPGSQVLIRNED